MKVMKTHTNFNRMNTNYQEIDFWSYKENNNGISTHHSIF